MGSGRGWTKGGVSSRSGQRIACNIFSKHFLSRLTGQFGCQGRPKLCQQRPQKSSESFKKVTVLFAYDVYTYNIYTYL